MVSNQYRQTNGQPDLVGTAKRAYLEYLDSLKRADLVEMEMDRATVEFTDEEWITWYHGYEARIEAER